MKSKATRKKQPQSESPWVELAKATSFSVVELRVLQEHHTTLHRFCVDPETAEKEKQDEDDVETSAEDAVVISASEAPVASTTDTSLELSFEQYCHCLQSLIKYGSATQQFEYLFQTYALENERGISRAELFQLLQEHYKSKSSSATASNAKAASSANNDASASALDARYFERLYTWLKKHVNVYDRTRCGYLSLLVTLEMLQTHPEAMYHLQFQVAPFIKKLDENNKHYRAKAQAAAFAM